ncbi:DUF309 domain-containing protein [Alkalihalobacterium bogoriense]|uniref:DUF309 domain-containing protein n=1 Tax=Alkalihalobacterium bogoriense TaxID=246272 RepID=UPI00047B7105|nr:DUF309 domain-containing protein [Alkalihalobacterium bogoriense]
MYPQPYIDYLVHFHGLRDYFECHEILEEYWKEAPIHEREKHWVGLIQLAVGLYHYRRNNRIGANKMLESAKTIITHEQAKLTKLGIDVSSLLHQITQCIESLQTKKPYKDIDIPLHDEHLLAICREHCERHHCLWGAPTDFSNEFLLHKHTLRDRSDVIEERQHQKKIRKEKKKGI